jgi:hypothetical protein
MLSDVYFPRVNGVFASIQNFQGELRRLGYEIRRLLDDAPLRQRLGEEGRVYARQWMAEGPAQALLARYPRISRPPGGCLIGQAASRL